MELDQFRRLLEREEDFGYDLVEFKAGLGKYFDALYEYEKNKKTRHPDFVIYDKGQPYNMIEFINYWLSTNKHDYSCYTTIENPVQIMFIYIK